MENWRRKRSRLVVVAAVCTLLLLLIIIGVCVGIKFLARSGADSREELKKTIISRCETYLQTNYPSSSQSICITLWMTFTTAFVGKDPCSVPSEAYDPLIHAITKDPTCNRTLFWSKTKVIAHKFTKEKKCLVTLEDTLLGNVLDGLTWCGKNYTDEIFTIGCPGWTDCVLNPVRSFWIQASGSFAERACGEATVMLNGSILTPFNPTSVFGSIEVKRLNATRVSGLTALLVTQENHTTNCNSDSMQNLQKVLDPSLKYSCKVVPQPVGYGVLCFWRPPEIGRRPGVLGRSRGPRPDGRK